ncbi:MAG: hypothetical protein GY751_00225 [Bacteroidetes bacterium]|nr:hypothetical protein [Bacteroidota bacterium]
MLLIIVCVAIGLWWIYADKIRFLKSMADRVMIINKMFQSTMDEDDEYQEGDYQESCQKEYPKIHICTNHIKFTYLNYNDEVKEAYIARRSSSVRKSNHRIIGVNEDKETILDVESDVFLHITPKQLGFESVKIVSNDKVKRIVETDLIIDPFFDTSADNQWDDMSW